MNPKVFEKYPISAVFAFQFVSLVNYAVGIYLLYLINQVFAGLFIVYIIALELFTYKEGCSSCYYYGKRCMSGRGKIAPLFVKKGNSRDFCKKQITWKNLLPTVLLSLIPIIAGVYLLIQSFSFLVLGLMLVPVLTWFIGNPLLYGKLGCLHCKQGRICCPANEFFGKNK